MGSQPLNRSHTYTYSPADPEGAQIVDFARILREARRTVSENRPALVGPDGERREIPEPVFDALRQVADALVAGMGVTVAPRNARLTTQEAADFLGISRPTLVRMLERGDLPMEKPGRHRFVRLHDLIAFQEERGTRRRETLDRMEAESAEDGLYDATDGQTPPRR